MRYQVTIQGTSPLVMHCGASGLDVRSAANQEKAAIAKKRGSNRTEADDIRLRELDCYTSLWLDGEGAPTVPEAAIRAVIENGAKKLKQGPQVREGLVVEKTNKFHYDESLGNHADELCKTVQFTVGVVVQRSRILRTRARFEKWGVTFTVEVDDELVDREQLLTWLEIAGRRVGFGDWRPQKSGHFGRFDVTAVEPLS